MIVANVFPWFVETSVSISLLLLAILLIRKPVAHVFGPGAVYFLWAIPFGRLFLPQLNILPAAPSIQDDVIPLANNLATSPPISHSDPAVYGALSDASFSMMDFLVAGTIMVWALITLALIGRALERYRSSINRLAAHHEEPSEPLRTLMIELANDYGLHKPPRLIILSNQHGPFVAGFLRPTIYLPKHFTINYTPAEQRLALSHEIAHISRGDLLANIIANTFLALNWFNPLAWIAIRAFNVDQEAACDESVLSRHTSQTSRGHYLEAIMKSVHQNMRHQLPGLSLNHPLKERLMYLKSEKKTKKRKSIGRLAVASLGLVGLLSTASYGFAQSENTDTSGQKATKRVVIINSDAGEDLNIAELLSGSGEDIDFEVLKGDGSGKDIKIIKHVKKLDGESSGEHIFEFAEGDDKGEAWQHHCSNEDGKSTKLEYKDETGEGDDKRVDHRIICLSGDKAADPEKRAEAFREIIEKMEAQAKQEEKQRKKVIEGLRAELRKLEAAEKKKKN